jgi:hypothetical protein
METTVAPAIEGVDHESDPIIPTFETDVSRAKALFDLGHPVEALALVKSAEKIDRSRYEAPALAAAILRALDRGDAARAALEDARQLAPSNR